MKSSNDDYDPLLKDKEICRILKCARSTLWAWRRRGIVPPPTFVINGRNLTFPHVILAWLPKGE